MNNDGLVNYADINPFVQALNNPAAYAYAHPGLGGLPPDLSVGGSRVWHGDLNCNDTLTYADINPLSTRIGQGCCLPTCGLLLRPAGRRRPQPAGAGHQPHAPLSTRSSSTAL